MKKLKKSLIIIISLVFILVLLITRQVFASNNQNLIQRKEYSEEFKKWLELSDEEKKKVMQPRPFDVINNSNISKNPLYKAKMTAASIDTKFNLKTVIPDNLSIRNQQQTNSCWAFAALSSLETNIALSNWKNNTNTSKIYDFSERHMEYATSRIFKNNAVNTKGYNRNVGDGGNWYYAQSYLTNGTGAINESDMKFENNEDQIELSQIQNKTVTSQVYDTIEFEDYMKADAGKKNEIMNQIKQHIQNYGSVFASIHGDSSSSSIYPCYNNDTGAIYCSNSLTHKPDHAISIIGWDDNYPIDNFHKDSKPKSPGAWIIRNSWGEREEYKLQEFKEMILEALQNQGYDEYTDVSQITDDMIKTLGFTIEGDIAYKKIGDNGIMYVSYEDCNISKTINGIVKATDDVDYENIYQYDEYFPAYQIGFRSKNIMLCNVFDRKNSSGKEYLTQVSLYAPETYTCKVYVNPNGEGKTQNDLQSVKLKSGESETFNAGYHTLEFEKPVEITGNKFTVVIEIEGTNSNELTFLLEVQTDQIEQLKYAKVETGKCFVAPSNDLSKPQWQDLGKLSSLSGLNLSNGDSTIKAFTVSQVFDESLQKIEITKQPTKKEYFEGDNFQKEGMEVKAYYNSKKKPSAILNSTDYSIVNGTNLTAGQKSVTIKYQDKSVEQPITVQKNSVTNLRITHEPTKKDYKEGQNFDSTGMIVEATFENGTTKTITDYTIKDGNNLSSDQTEVTISYGGKTVKQAITVKPNPLMEIKVTKAPDKVKYVVGQNFDKTGMIVTGTYQDGDTQEIKDYTIENGTNLSKGQTSVTIKFKEKTTTQSITVEEKTITQISVDKKPSKLKYTQGKEELDLKNGTLKITYNDGTTENISMTSEGVTVSGFSNKNVGIVTITVTYQNKTTQFQVEIVKEVNEIKAVNSNLDNIQCNIKNVQAYYFTNNSQNNYALINVEIDNISRNMSNDSLEYYYYLSPNPDEQNINSWTEITEEQKDSDKIQFTIDSRKMSNYNEIASEEVLYLYIKEVAIKGADTSIAVSKSMKLETDKDVETYVDNVKKEGLQSNISTGKSDNDDKTVAGGILPYTGVTAIVIALAIIMSIIGIVLYIKYKNLSKYIK